MDVAISSNSALKQAVEDYPIAKMISESLIEDEVRAVLAEVKGEAKVKPIAPKKKKDGSKWGPWIIAATFVGAMIASTYSWMRYEKVEARWVEVMENYVPPTNRNSTRSGSIEIDNAINFENAIHAFELRKFEKSKRILIKLSPKNDSIYYYLSHISLLEKSIGVAKNYERKIQNDEMKQDLKKYLSEF